jgi:hypothetical protein
VIARSLLFFVNEPSFLRHSGARESASPKSIAPIGSMDLGRKILHLDRRAARVIDLTIAIRSFNYLAVKELQETP